MISLPRKNLSDMDWCRKRENGHTAFDIEHVTAAAKAAKEVTVMKASSEYMVGD